MNKPFFEVIFEVIFGMYLATVTLVTDPNATHVSDFVQGISTAPYIDSVNLPIIRFDDQDVLLVQDSELVKGIGNGLQDLDPATKVTLTLIPQKSPASITEAEKQREQKRLNQVMKVLGASAGRIKPELAVADPPLGTQYAGQHLQFQISIDTPVPGELLGTTAGYVPALGSPEFDQPAEVVPVPRPFAPSVAAIKDMPLGLFVLDC